MKYTQRFSIDPLTELSLKLTVFNPEDDAKRLDVGDIHEQCIVGAAEGINRVVAGVLHHEGSIPEESADCSNQPIMPCTGSFTSLPPIISDTDSISTKRRLHLSLDYYARSTAGKKEIA